MITGHLILRCIEAFWCLNGKGPSTLFFFLSPRLPEVSGRYFARLLGFIFPYLSHSFFIVQVESVNFFHLVNRINYRRRCRYNTRRNHVRPIKTPGHNFLYVLYFPSLLWSLLCRNRLYMCLTSVGGRLVAQYFKRLEKGIPHNPKALGGKQLRGIPATTGMERHKLPRKVLTVARPYGGSLSHDIVRDRWVYLTLR